MSLTTPLLPKQPDDLPSAAVPIVDSEGRIVAVLAGRPSNDSSWNLVAAEAANELDSKRPMLRFRNEEVAHRRGNFAAKGYGISHGGGQTKPGNLVHSPANRAILQSLIANQAFKRLAGFASGTHLPPPRRLRRY